MRHDDSRRLLGIGSKVYEGTKMQNYDSAKKLRWALHMNFFNGSSHWKECDARLQGTVIHNFGKEEHRDRDWIQEQVLGRRYLRDACISQLDIRIIRFQHAIFGLLTQ